MELTRINNDTNGNPRYVVAYSELLNENDEAKAREMAKQPGRILFFVDYEYEIAINKAKKIGGRKFHNKQFGGGIVFQSYNTDALIKRIEEVRNS